MNQQAVVLQMPDELYERVRQIAHDSQTPMETVLLDSLHMLFGDLYEITPQSLQALTDEQLWALVYRPLARFQDMRLQELTARGKAGNLTSAENAEIERLVSAVDRYVLLRTRALVELKQRGHDVERRLIQ